MRFLRRFLEGCFSKLAYPFQTAKPTDDSGGHIIDGSPQEFVKSAILRGLRDFLEGDEFRVCGGRAFSFQ